METAQDKDYGLMKNAVHFIGFRDSDRFRRAIAIWGSPDFIHRVWDCRAKAEIMDGDTAVFAKGNDADPPSEFTYDDSAYQ